MVLFGEERGRMEGVRSQKVKKENGRMEEWKKSEGKEGSKKIPRQVGGRVQVVLGLK